MWSNLDELARKVKEVSDLAGKLNSDFKKETQFFMDNAKTPEEKNKIQEIIKAKRQVELYANSGNMEKANEIINSLKQWV